MKYLIVSDIHGSIDSANIIIRKFNELKCDMILCLGDVLYHGPRNDLPANYNPKEVIKLLNDYKDKIICIKGNCEAEVDQMVLDFKILDSYDSIINNISVHLEHGHHLDEYKGDERLVLFGHTHVPKLDLKDNHIFINPGSITIPKNNSKRSYAIWDDNTITCLSTDDDVVFKYTY